MTAAALSGTHAVRLTVPPMSLANGSTYYELDRLATYQVINGAWVLTSGTPAVAAASLPNDLTTADTGYTATDPNTGITYRWDGVTFQQV